MKTKDFIVRSSLKHPTEGKGGHGGMPRMRVDLSKIAVHSYVTCRAPITKLHSFSLS